MGSRRAGNCEHVLNSPSCLEGSHEECGHWRGYRAAFNLRRLRREGFAMLCGCGCHSCCPVTSEENTVGDPVWRKSCTCPGAEAMRGIRDQVETHPVEFFDFREGWARYRQESKSRREALKAAQASAAGCASLSLLRCRDWSVRCRASSGGEIYRHCRSRSGLYCDCLIRGGIVLEQRLALHQPGDAE